MEIDSNGRIIRPEGFDPDVCILDLDSPSYPPTDEEREQCGCRACLDELARVKETPWAI